MGAQYNKFGNPTQQLEKRLNRGRQGQRHRPAAARAAPSNQQPDAHQAQVRSLITNPDERRFDDPDTKYSSPEDGEMWSEPESGMALDAPDPAINLAQLDQVVPRRRENAEHPQHGHQ
jgi:hypothetical protein